MRLARVTVVLILGLFSVLFLADAVAAQPPRSKTSIREDLATTKRGLETARQSPELAEPSRKALQIRAELERTADELDDLQKKNVSKTDVRYKQISVRLADQRQRLLALQKQLNDQEKALNKKETESADSKERSEAARERRRQSLDNIQKLLDIIRGMNPQI